MNSALWKTCIGGFATAVFCAATCVTSFGAEAKSLEDMEKELNSLKATISGLTEQMELVKHEKVVAATTTSNTKEDVAALKNEVSTLKEEMRIAADATPPLKAEDIAGNVYSEFAKKVKLGGQIRTRAEYANGFYQVPAGGAGYNEVIGGTGITGRSEKKDDGYVLNQTRLWADADVNEHLRMFIQLQDSRAWGSEGTTVGYASGASDAGPENSMLDIHQGYFDIRKLFDMPLTVRAGRQEIIWGDHRVLGNFVWSNVGRVFDAARFMWDTDTIHAEAIAAKVDEDGFTTLGTNGNGSGSSDENMYAAQLAFKKLVPSALLELMYICKSDQDDTGTSAYGGTGYGSAIVGAKNTYAEMSSAVGDPVNIHDFGARIDGKVPNLEAMDYTLESHVQVGNYGTKNQEAWAFAGKTGYTIKNVAWTPRIGFEYDYASGDSDPTDGTHETFDNLYPTNHWAGIYGFADLVSWQNMHDFRGNIKVSPTKKMTAQVDYHYFMLAEEADGWYLANASLATARTNGAGASIYNTKDDELAQEVDLTVSYDLYKNVKILAGYSYFAAGDWIENNIGDTDTNWAYLQTTVTF